MIGWPLVCVALFVSLPTEKAAIWSLLGGYMLLPSDWNIIDHPPMDKMDITSIATLLLCWMKGSRAPRPRASMLMCLVAFAFVISPIFTSLDNGYELQSAGLSVHGFYPSDGVKFAVRNLMSLIPLYIGWRFVSTDNARSLLLKALPSAMLAYSLPMLFEIRMSPQLHRLVYGYFPGASDSWIQQIRAGGFRPVVFFSHGLTLAFFTALALLAAVIMIRTRARIARLPASAVAAYLSGLLILCKSLGPVIYAVVFAPMILFTKPRLWVRVGFAVSLVLCAYPLLRNHGLAPTQLVSDVAQSVSAERSASFEARLANEEQLLAKANRKAWFGWGGWGRNRIFDQWTGKDISVTDGGWIIQFGVYGWFGYLSLFGLFAVALFQALRTMDKEVTPANLTAGGLALLLTIYVIDSIPNASETSLVFLLAGCIASAPRVHRRSRKQPSSALAQMPAEELALAKSATGYR